MSKLFSWLAHPVFALMAPVALSIVLWNNQATGDMGIGQLFSAIGVVVVAVFLHLGLCDSRFKTSNLDLKRWRWGMVVFSAFILACAGALYTVMPLCGVQVMGAMLVLPAILAYAAYLRDRPHRVVTAPGGTAFLYAVWGTVGAPILGSVFYHVHMVATANAATNLLISAVWFSVLIIMLGMLLALGQYIQTQQYH